MAVEKVLTSIALIQIHHALPQKVAGGFARLVYVV